MTVIAIINQKGGSGKTTISTNLARYFSDVLNVVVVDSDPQGSASKWHEKGEGELLQMLTLNRPTLTKDIDRIRRNYDMIIIDGVPQISIMTIAAIKCADIILIPVQPSPYDVWATADTVNFVKDYQNVNKGKPYAAFVVSRKIVNTVLARDIADELAKYELPIFNSFTCQRVAYAESAADGHTVFETNSKEAKAEITKIAKEVERVICDLAE